MQRIIKFSIFFRIGKVIEDYGRKKNKHRLIRIGILIKGNR